MSDLLEKIIHHLEGVEVHHDKVLLHKDKKLIGTLRERKSWGTERWIRDVYTHQILSAFDLVAVIFFKINGLNFDQHHKITLEIEQRQVDSWAYELITSAESKEIKAIDMFTLLRFEGDLTKLDWAISVSDADSFLASRGIKWTCSDTVEHLYNETFGDEENIRPETDEPHIGLAVNNIENAGVKSGANDAVQADDAHATSVESNTEGMSNSNTTFGTTKRWTPEAVEELVAYHAVHGTKKAAEKYQVNDSRIRQVIRGNKPQPTANNPFVNKKPLNKTYRVKR